MDNTFHDMLVKRRSIRKYTDQEIPGDDVKQILEAALMSPTSKSARPWSFVVVEDKKVLELLGKCKPVYATSIANCSLAIVVTADSSKSDAWIEDCSVAATMIQLQAEALGLGSCWVQVRGRMYDEDTSSEAYVKGLLSIPDEQQVLCIISLGYKGEERRPFNPEKLMWERIQIDEWHLQD